MIRTRCAAVLTTGLAVGIVAGALHRTLLAAAAMAAQLTQELLDSRSAVLVGLLRIHRHVDSLLDHLQRIVPCRLRTLVRLDPCVLAGLSLLGVLDTVHAIHAADV